MAKGHGTEKSAKATSVKSTSARKAGPPRRSKDPEQPGVASALQQKCLDIFRDALQPTENDIAVLQEVKGHLYKRDFAAAFGKDEYLRVYASRWSPSRALAYLQILHSIETHLTSNGDESGVNTAKASKIVSLGGGAGAELVATAGWLSSVRDQVDDYTIQIHCVDIATWDSIVRELHRRIVTPPELSKYASAAAKEANKALLSDDAFGVHFTQQDVLSWQDTIQSEVVAKSKLVTLMFTLNELYTISIQKTQRLLSQLTTTMAPNALLLVVDSPGSYSTVSINDAVKKYPMQWLLDLTLLGARREAARDPSVPKWEKLMSDDSRWFRLPQGLRYPIELENMRYQIHLYRRLGDEEMAG